MKTNYYLRIGSAALVFLIILAGCAEEADSVNELMVLDEVLTISEGHYEDWGPSCNGVQDDSCDLTHQNFGLILISENYDETNYWPAEYSHVFALWLYSPSIGELKPGAYHIDYENDTDMKGQRVGRAYLDIEGDSREFFGAKGKVVVTGKMPELRLKIDLEMRIRKDSESEEIFEYVPVSGDFKGKFQRRSDSF